MSAGARRLTYVGHPGCRTHDRVAYNASKAALNVATISLAKELRDTSIKVNAADPGYTRTEMNQGDGDQDADQGALAAVHLATLPPEGPTGTFIDKDGRAAW